ncbi:hypothetical protein QBC34DRAFT_162877 [Podospora aff. communis PSN243]|uniref:SWR1-complex protein 3 domain-containing protein n=1 Tax=Podospora aff. communis PSN243 TaxID=3040156 RepID=A0AAV9GBS8_9PEZI|nr:hypothetical protein QBC34DRAFT_162877 [Podospora aff. communis PSN243]
MERKRKLPARAAARVEQASKKRMSRSSAVTSTPQKSPTPETAPEPEPEPAAVEEVPPPLPKSIAAGKPLPTVDSPQPEDLSAKDYQSVSESGVLGEALTRSRQKWVGENVFEKWWSKPIKRKGVTIEDPGNPPKHSMSKLGTVQMYVGPHILDATMYAIKEGPWIREPPPQSDSRPIIQYGPPGGTMPPLPTPKQPTPKPSPPAEPVASAPTPVPAVSPAQPAAAAAAQAQAQAKTQTLTQTLTQTPVQQPPGLSQPAPQAQVQPPIPTPPPPAHGMLGAAPMAAVPGPRPPMASPRGMESVLNTVNPPPIQRPPLATPQAVAQPPRAVPSPGVPAAGPAVAARPAGAPPAPKAAPGADPIILTLAEKAGEDPHLRELMKRVAQGDAAKHELERFQAIIDAITAESKRKGSAALGLSADRLHVIEDGRTVRYFADEVRAILDIVLSSNPTQTSADLRPPEGSDPLVVALVKAALDDIKTSERVRRIASNKPLFSDSMELKVILDRLQASLSKEKGRQERPQPSQLATSAGAAKPSGPLNGSDAAPSPTATPTTAQQPTPQQGLRSKGPPKPPQPKSDVVAVCMEFFSGSGDRFLFPKFSVLEALPSPAGQGGTQVVASFLIVRKGSMAEYPAADPELDYYQPVTIRIWAPTGRFLDHLFRVVAPQEDVRRYMDDIMDNMTRAEYVLLAMRLPRADVKDGEDSPSEEKDRDKALAMNGAKSSETESAIQGGPPQQLPPSVLWGTSKTTKPTKPETSLPRRRLYAGFTDDDDDQYRSFVSQIAGKEPKEA